MKIFKITAAVCALCIMLCACGSNASVKQPKPESAQALSGEVVEEIEGTSGPSDFSYASDKAMIADMTLGCENDAYALYYNQKSMATALVDKKTGKTFLSNPFDASKDPFYSGDVAKKLSSQVYVDYYDSDNACYSLYSSADCAELGQYKISRYSDGLRFDLSLGEEKGNLLNPAVFTTEKFESILSKLEGRDAGRFEYYYMYIDLDQVTDVNRKNDLEAQYPALKKAPLYVLSTDLGDKEKIQLDEALQKAGYTREDYRADMEKYGFTENAESYVNFRLSLVYRLTEDGMSVTVPQDSISASDNFYLSSITVLPYFAADCEQSGKDGYLFIPDGTGALIDINHQNAQRRRLITNCVYGYDAALNQKKDLNGAGMTYYLPTFGIKRNNGTAVAAIIEKGDEMSEITASLGDPNSNYYTVYNTFVYTAGEVIIHESKVSSMGSAKPLYLHDDNLSHTDYTISYHLLSGDQANYSGMAKVMRNYLMQKGMKENPDARVHTGIETMGSAQYKTSFLGFSYYADAVFTTYDQNTKILDYFKKNGLSDLSLSLKGWQDGGMDVAVSNRIRFSDTLGGKADFSKLWEYCGKNDTPIYPLADFAYIGKDVSGDDYTRKNDAARQISRDYAELAVYNPATGMYDKARNVLSPIRYEKFFRSLTESCKKNDLSMLCLDSFGTKLNSDFDEKKSSNRVQTRIRLESLLKSNKDIRLSFNGANAYILPYASMISDLPLTNSEYPGESASVPFLQLVVSGCMDYESQALNLMNDIPTQLLYCIASGTSPKFMLAYDNVAKLKLTNYTNYYAISFGVLKDDVLKYGKYVNKALAATDGTALTSNDRLADGVTVSRFENGAVIYVNTSDQNYSAGGVTVKAKSYYVAKGEKAK